MTIRTPVFIVCSLSGRVGKTTVARLLGDYFLSSQREFCGFDTDAHEHDFAARFPKRVIVTDINTIQGQMALIDPLLENDATPKIIDLWHRSFEAFFQLIDHTRFIAEAQARGVVPILLYVDDGSPDAVTIAARIRARYPRLQVMMVFNQIASLDGSDKTSPPPLGNFRIGCLDPLLRATTNATDFAFSQFMRAPSPDMSIVLRARLRDWVWRIFSQFKSFELRLMLNESQHFR